MTRMGKNQGLTNIFPIRIIRAIRGLIRLQYQEHQPSVAFNLKHEWIFSFHSI